MPIKKALLQHKTFKDYVHWARTINPTDLTEVIALVKTSNDEIGEQMATLLSCAAAFCAAFETDDIDDAYQKFLTLFGSEATE